MKYLFGLAIIISSCSSNKIGGNNFSKRLQYYQSSDRVFYNDTYEEGDTINVDRSRTFLRFVSLGANTTNWTTISEVNGRNIEGTYGEPYEFMDIMLATDTLKGTYYNWSLRGCWTDKNLVIEIR